jgi:hypothetical protein
MMSRLRLALLCAVLPLAISGCAVVAVADATVTVAATAVSVGAKTVGLAADATIGTARLVGRAITPAEPKAGESKSAEPKATAATPPEAARPAAAPVPASDPLPAPAAAQALPVEAPQPIRAAPL